MRGYTLAAARKVGCSQSRRHTPCAVTDRQAVPCPGQTFGLETGWKPVLRRAAATPESIEKSERIGNPRYQAKSARLDKIQQRQLIGLPDEPQRCLQGRLSLRNCSDDVRVDFER